MGVHSPCGSVRFDIKNSRKALSSADLSATEKVPVGPVDTLHKKMAAPAFQVIGMATTFTLEVAAKILAEQIGPPTRQVISNQNAIC